MMATWQGTSDPVPSTSGGVGDDYKLIYPRDKIIYKVSERGQAWRDDRVNQWALAI